MLGPSHRNSSFSSVVNTALVSTGIGAIRQGFTKDQVKSDKFNIATGKVAVAEKLTLQITKLKTMVD